MRITTQGRRLSLLLVAMALFGFVASADAAVWSPDFNISGGDVEEAYSALNGQRTTVVGDSNNAGLADIRGGP